MNDTQPRWLAKVALIAIIAGGAVRIWAVSNRGAPWLDEASLALNIVGRDFGELAGPLDWGQAAPIGFLWLTKALVLALNGFEGTMRLWPFIAGILTPALVWRVGRRLAGDSAALLATVAVALSLIAIRYSSEAKPYAPDACIALALVWLATEVLERPAELRRWWVLGIGGALAVVFSLPSAFVLGAIGIALARPAWTNGARAALLASASAWLATFGGLWFLAVGPSSADPYLQEYWAPVMLDPSTPDFVARVIRMLASVSATPLRWLGNIPFAIAAIVVAICGVYSLARRNPTAAILLAGPAALGAVASIAGLYPMSDRLAFFAAPLILIVSAKCVAELLRAVTARLSVSVQQAAFAGALIGVGVLTATDSWRMLKAPGSLEQTRKLFIHVYGFYAKRDSAPVYVFARAAPAWVFITEWPLKNRERFEFYRQTTGQTSHAAHENFAHSGAATPVDPDKLVFAADSLTELIGVAPGVRYRIVGPTSRDGPWPGWAEQEARRIRAVAKPYVWIVASHFFEGTDRDELRPLVQAMRAAGLHVVEEQRGGRDAVALRVEALPAPR